MYTDAQPTCSSHWKMPQPFLWLEIGLHDSLVNISPSRESAILGHIKQQMGYNTYFYQKKKKVNNSRSAITCNYLNTIEISMYNQNVNDVLGSH